jgi:hypothetical protein
LIQITVTLGYKKPLVCGRQHVENLMTMMVGL